MARKRREEREGTVSERSKSLDHPYCVHTNALFFLLFQIRHAAESTRPVVHLSYKATSVKELSYFNGQTDGAPTQKSNAGNMGFFHQSVSASWC